MRSRRVHPALVVLAVTLLAAGVRFWEVGEPPNRVFDEVYYSKVGCLWVGYPQKECGIRSDDERYWVDLYYDVGSWVHPPLGKWAIGVGERLFGPDAFGWRASAALFGTLTVAVVAITVQLMFGSVLWTFVGGLLMALENLSVVQSRISMLDVFLAFWVALGFMFLVLDRRWIERRKPPDPEAARVPGASEGLDEASAAPPAVPSPILRPWRLAAGLALGAACATKWSGVLALAAAALLALGWEVTRRREGGVRHPILRTLLREPPGLLLAFLVLPAVVYAASYAGWFAHFGLDLDKWWSLQRAIWDQHFHGFRPFDPKTHEPTHPYESQPWTWLLLLRPVLYYAKYLENDVRRIILAVGNPAVFWLAIPALADTAFAWAWKRDWRAGFAFLPAVVQYLPWFFVSRVQFLFYMMPVVPFLILADVYFLRDMTRVRLSGAGSPEEERGVRPFLPVAVGVVVIAVALFVFFWPVLTAQPISKDAWSWRMWFGSRWV